MQQKKIIYTWKVKTLVDASFLYPLWFPNMKYQIWRRHENQSLKYHTVVQTSHDLTTAVKANSYHFQKVQLRFARILLSSTLWPFVIRLRANAIDSKWLGQIQAAAI